MPKPKTATAPIPGPYSVANYNSRGGGRSIRIIAKATKGHDILSKLGPTAFEQRLATAKLFTASPQLLEACIAASHALRSYQYGNGAPDLAEQTADALETAVRGGSNESEASMSSDEKTIRTVSNFYDKHLKDATKPTPDTATGAGNLRLEDRHYGSDIYQGNILRAEVRCGCGTEDDMAFARDLTHRWNTQPDLVKALDAALDFIAKSPGDPDVTNEQIEAYVKMQEVKPHEILLAAKDSGS